MAVQVQSFNPAAAKIRYGRQSIKGIPANQSELTIHPRFSSEGMTNAGTLVTATTIEGAGQPAETLDGSLNSGGPIGTDFDPDGHMGFIGNYMRCFADPVEINTDVWSTLFSPTQDNAYPRELTVEIDRNDQQRQRFDGSIVSQLVFTGAIDSVFTGEVTIVAELGEYFDDGVAVASNPATKPLFLRGFQRPPFWRGLTEAPDGDLRIRLSDITDETSWDVQVMLGSPLLTGTSSVTGGTPNVVGVGTRYLSEVRIGDTLDLDGEDGVVEDVLTDTTLTLDANHSAGASAVVVARQYGSGTSTVRPGVDPKGAQRWEPLEFSFDGSRVGKVDLEIEVHAEIDGLSSAFGAPASPVIDITGTVTIGAGTAAVAGAGTAFTTDLSVGSVFRANSELHRVFAIADDTNLTLHRVHVAGAVGGSTASTDAEWEVAQTRPDWVVVSSTTPKLNVTAARLFIDGEDLKVQDFTITTARPAPPDFFVGARRPDEILLQGADTITGTLTMRYKDTDLRKAIEGGETFELQILVSSGAKIASPAPDFHSITLNMPECKSVSPTPTVADGTEFIQTVEFNCNANAAGSIGQDALEIVLVTGIANPLTQ